MHDSLAAVYPSATDRDIDHDGGSPLDELRGREPDQRQADAPHARELSVSVDRLEEMRSSSGGIVVGEIRPRHLGKDPRFLGTITDRGEGRA